MKIQPVIKTMVYTQSASMENCWENWIRPFNSIVYKGKDLLTKPTTGSKLSETGQLQWCKPKIIFYQTNNRPYVKKNQYYF